MVHARSMVVMLMTVVAMVLTNEASIPVAPRVIPWIPRQVSIRVLMQMIVTVMVRVIRNEEKGHDKRGKEGHTKRGWLRIIAQGAAFDL
jgi:hypothetical protein